LGRGNECYSCRLSYMEVTMRKLLLTFLLFNAMNAHAVIAAPDFDVTSYILIDADSGVVLAEKNADKRIEPASVTKMMSAYVVDEALVNGEISPNHWVLISQNAAQVEGTRMGVTPNSKVRVEDLYKGMIIVSGNDASIALAEFIAGSEKDFSVLMNEEAARLGMVNSNFMNATGLPNADHYSTARDLAVLSRALIKDYPDLYPQYSEESFTYKGEKKPNSNVLLKMDPSVDGIKTGYTKAAGYCLVSSAKRGDMRLIAVVMGSKTLEGRSDYSLSLLNYGFDNYETHKLYAANTPVSSLPLWMGQENQFNVGVTEDLYVTIPRGEYQNIQASLNVPPVVKAPVAQQQTYGNLQLTLHQQTLIDKPLVALNPVAEGAWWKNTYDYFKLAFVES
jgi:D-alanyl-D-alanine carboxypeptidase (penicillin-binding protein 5/6)